MGMAYWHGLDGKTRIFCRCGQGLLESHQKIVEIPPKDKRRKPIKMWKTFIVCPNCQIVLNIFDGEGFA